MIVPVRLPACRVPYPPVAAYLAILATVVTVPESGELSRGNLHWMR